MTPLKTYDVGDLVELVGTFTDPESGELVDPADVVCTVKAPDATISTPAAAGQNGVYVATVTPDQSGYWSYAFDGTGGHQASGERRFQVRQQTVPRSA